MEGSRSEGLVSFQFHLVGPLSSSGKSTGLMAHDGEGSRLRECGLGLTPPTGQWWL